MAAEYQLNIPLDDWALPFKDGTIKPNSRDYALNLLGFEGVSPESITAEDIRRRAISIRAKGQGDGVSIKVEQALSWVLKITNDCLDDSEFADFWMKNENFETILHKRVPEGTTHVLD